ncbi:hypothetical protein ACH5RR_013399 [Cinchona calisaya]|uniref:Uncharacterized protein n=1 Tax=Cinchona calisaya TaxID=153742 RepID=A0ABD3A016_9GENT
MILIKFGAFLRGLVSTIPATATATGTGSSSQPAPSSANRSSSPIISATSESARAIPGIAVDLTLEVQTILGGSSDDRTITLAMQPTTRPEPEVIRVTKKRTRNIAAIEAGPSSSGTMASSSSPIGPTGLGRIVRTPRKAYRNLSLNKQYITAYDRKCNPKEERMSARSRDLPWAQVSIDPFSAPSTSGSTLFLPIPLIDINDRS